MGSFRKAAAAAMLLALGTQPAVAAARPSLDPKLLLHAARSGRPVVLPLPDGMRAIMVLHQTSVLAPGVRFTATGADGRLRDVPREPFTTLAGTVRGGGVVRLTVMRDIVSGIAQVGERWYSIDPDNWSRPSRTVVSRTDKENGSAAPLHNDMVIPTAPPVPPVGVGIANCSAFPCDRLTTSIVLDGDSFFRDQAPVTCQTRQIAVFNDMKVIFGLAATRIDLTTSLVNCRETSDLGTTSSTAVAYLAELRAAWEGRLADRSAVQLSVGFSFAGTDSIGVAYLPGVCQRIIVPMITGLVPQSCDYGYSLYQTVPRPNTNYTATAFLKAKLAAHEMGHNFNAAHDAPSLCPPLAPRTGPIMCAIIQESGPNTFSTTRAGAIRSHAQQNIGSLTGT